MKDDIITPEQVYKAQRAFASAAGANGPEQPIDLDDSPMTTRAGCYGMALLLTLIATQDTSDGMLKRMERVKVPKLDHARTERIQATAVDQFCTIVELLDVPR